MIRITHNQVHRMSLTAVTDARVRMQKAQEVALSGQRVNLPGDDPVAASRARLLSELDAAAASHRENIAYGAARLSTAEAALAEIGNQLTRAKELALAMANETLTASQRESAATEVAEIRRSVVDLINTKHNGEYVFAGVDTRSPPYDESTGFTYDVDTYQDVRRVEIGPGQTGEIGASGSRAFAALVSDPQSLDVVQALATLESDLLANDPDAVRLSVDALDLAFNQVLGERAAVGVRTNRLHTAEQASAQSSLVYQTLRSELIDADAAEAFSNLTLAETTMQAAVTVAARVLGPSLLDVL